MRARPTHRAEETVVRTTWENTAPALLLPAAGTLNAVANRLAVRMTARTSGCVTGPDEASSLKGIRLSLSHWNRKPVGQPEALDDVVGDRQPAEHLRHQREAPGSSASFITAPSA